MPPRHHIEAEETEADTGSRLRRVHEMLTRIQRGENVSGDAHTRVTAQVLTSIAESLERIANALERVGGPNNYEKRNRKES